MEKKNVLPLLSLDIDILVTNFFQHFRCHSVDFWLSLFLMNFSHHSFSCSTEDMLFPLATYKVFSFTLYFSGLTRVFPLRISTPWIWFSLFLPCLGSWDSCICEIAFNNFRRLATVKSLVLLPHFFAPLPFWYITYIYVRSLMLSHSLLILCSALFSFLS